MKIKELRQITGLSQTKFAKKFHIPTNTVRGWEQEKRSPPEYVPGIIEEIIRMEQAPIRGQQTINYKPLSDNDILNDDAAAAAKPEVKEILKKVEKFLLDIDPGDIFCENCKYGKACHYQHLDCEKYKKTKFEECENVQNWIYWEELERMIDEC